MQQPILVVHYRESPDAAERVLRFERSPVHIGRGPHNELRIDHAFVSHQHATLHFDASGVDFVDLGSTNGSVLDGRPVESRRFVSVYAGAELAIGIARMQIRLDVRGEHSVPEARSDEPRASANATSLAAVIERFAETFLALSKEQHAWRSRIGLARSQRSGMHALKDPLALIAYLLAPGHEASRLEELEVACEELLCNERALARAVAQDSHSLEGP